MFFISPDQQHIGDQFLFCDRNRTDLFRLSSHGSRKNRCSQSAGCQTHGCSGILTFIINITGKTMFFKNGQHILSVTLGKDQMMSGQFFQCQFPKTFFFIAINCSCRSSLEQNPFKAIGVRSVVTSRIPFSSSSFSVKVDPSWITKRISG